MKTEPQKEHDWLEKLVGKWTYEGGKWHGLVTANYWRKK